MTADSLLKAYRDAPSDDLRADVAARLIRRAPADDAALDALLFVLNDERESAVRLAIVRFLQTARPRAAVRALAKEMFDPDPLVRANAAVALAGYDDPHLLAPALAACFDALPDPVTRTAAERVVLAVTGKPASQIGPSDRERVRRGERPETLWPDHFAKRAATPIDASGMPPGATD